MESDRFRTGQELVEVGVLGQEPNVGAAADFVAGDAEYLRGSGGGGNQTQDDLKRGAFARAVGAQKSINMACRDIEGDPLECGYLTTAQGDGEYFPEIPDADGDFFHLSR
jgi:hypothetical protein